MIIRLATWNINSVRLRLPLVAQFISTCRPDILCLQETKCPDGLFPWKDFAALGYPHIALNGQKGYHGVAVVSRIPIVREFSENLDQSGEARHLGVRLAFGSATGLVLHNFYVPAGGDAPDPEANPKFRQKLIYLQAMQKWFTDGPLSRRRPMILLGDLNVAPLETDVWSHKQLLKVVSHTPVEVEHLMAVQKSLGWVDVVRSFIPPEEKLFTWWSYRARDWRASNRGRRLDHIWMTPDLCGCARKAWVATDARDWPKASDHVPVIADFEID